MYFKFSGAVQRLAAAGASDAYCPQVLSAGVLPPPRPRSAKGLRPVVSREAAPIVFAGAPHLPSAAPAGHAGRNRVPELQRFFQKPDGLPVHLKRGLPDRMLYRTTMALTLGGTLYCLVALYMAAQPRGK